MSVTLNQAYAYGLTGIGTKVKMGEIQMTISDANLVGGKLYHVVTGDNGAKYIFFDVHGRIIDPVTTENGVEKLNSNAPDVYGYIKTGTSTFDKFYVYNDDIATSKTWTYKADDAWVYNLLGTEDGIGKGKTNTNIVMAADSGAYAAYANTIWNALATARTNQVGGCSDWFVPSKAEVEALRSAIGFRQLTTSDDPVVVPASVVTGGVIAGDYDGEVHYKDYNTVRMCYPSATKFLNNYIWSSYEYSAQTSWYWTYGSQGWNHDGKTNRYSVLFARAF